MRGTIARFDFSGTTFGNCRFDRVGWVGCLFNEATAFVNCHIIGGAPPIMWQLTNAVASLKRHPTQPTRSNLQFPKVVPEKSNRAIVPRMSDRKSTRLNSSHV